MQDIVTLLWPRLMGLLSQHQRIMIGICGAPGSGKSTLAQELATYCALKSVHAAVVPMDGFHLANAILDARGWRNEKGAIHTFDADGYVNLLQRIKGSGHRPIYAPRYIRGSIEESQACAVEISADVEVVITEGNYLLMPTEPWASIKDVVDEVWYLEIDDDLRRKRLRNRHLAHGKTPAQAELFTTGSDERNAHMIAETMQYADLIINPETNQMKEPS